jgi:pyridoxine 5-phosphate synthase
MAATDEMTAIALRVRPHAACLVPERREERTTEGGLDVAGGRQQIGPVVKALGAAGIRVSLFIAPDPAQIEAAAELGAPVVELHTGAWCEAVVERNPATALAEFQRLRAGVAQAARLGLETHAGHGLDYLTAEAICALPEIVELNIGHFLVGEAVFDGLAHVVTRMRTAMGRGRGKSS